MMLKAPGLFLHVLLLIAPRNSRASGITIYTSDLDNKYITFPTEYFSKFYECLCDSRKTCTAEYYMGGANRYYVNKVVPGDSDNAEVSGSSVYYYCSYKSSLTIACEKSRGNATDNRHTYHNYEKDCHYSCFVFIWSHTGEQIDFTTSELNVQFCYSNCVCSLPTTKNAIQTTAAIGVTTTTTTLPTTTRKLVTTATTTRKLVTTATTTTTASPESTTVTSLTTKSADSTPASEAPNSTNKNSNDDPQTGLIIGVVLAVICFIAVVIAIISFVFWRRNQRQSTSKPRNGNQIATVLNELNNVSSTRTPDARHTNTHDNVLYNVASMSNNYTEIDVETSDAFTNNAYEYAKAFNQNSGNETKSSSAMPKKGNKKMPKTPTVSELKGNKTLPAGSNQTQTKSGSFPGKEQEGIAMTASQDGDYGYSTVQDHSIGHDDYDTVPVTQYDHTIVMKLKNKDTGYEYAGADSTYDTDTANKSGVNNEEGDMYSTAGNIKDSITSPSTNHTQDIYSRLHEESRQINNPYNTLLQPHKEVHDPQTTTGSSVDQPQPKNIYSRLHEENRQVQNPYNTLLQPTQDTHISQTANPPSPYSFAQPISDRMSNEETGDSWETNNAATSQNNTNYVPEGEEENRDTSAKNQNTYFELEKEENVSDS